MSVNLNPNSVGQATSLLDDVHNQKTQPASTPTDGLAQPRLTLDGRVRKHGQLLIEHERFQNKIFFANRRQITALEKQITALQLQIFNLQKEGLNNQCHIKPLEIQIDGLREQINSIEEIAATKDAELATKFQSDLPANIHQVDEIARDQINSNAQPLQSDISPLTFITSNSASIRMPKNQDLILPAMSPQQRPTTQPLILRPTPSVELKKWKRGNQDIVLLREGDTLKYQIFNKTTSQIEKEGNVDIVSFRDVTIEQQIAHLTYSHPIIGVDGEIRWAEIDNVLPPPQINEQEKAELIADIQKNKNAYQLYHARESLKDDKDLILNAIQVDYRAFCFASERLKDEKDVVLAAVQKSSSAFKHASDRLKKDRDVVLAAIQRDVCILENIEWQLRCDRGVVLAAIQKDGQALWRYASSTLHNDKVLAIAAVEQTSHALYFAPDQIKDDKDVVLAAVRKDGGFPSLNNANQRFRSDKEVIMAAILASNGGWVQSFSELAKNGRAVLLLAILTFRSRADDLLREANDQLKNDKGVVLAAVQLAGHALRHANESLKNDKDVVLAALQQNAGAYQYVSDHLKNNDAEVKKYGPSWCILS